MNWKELLKKYGPWALAAAGAVYLFYILRGSGGSVGASDAAYVPAAQGYGYAPGTAGGYSVMPAQTDSSTARGITQADIDALSGAIVSSNDNWWAAHQANNGTDTTTTGSPLAKTTSSPLNTIHAYIDAAQQPGAPSLSQAIAALATVAQNPSGFKAADRDALTTYVNVNYANPNYKTGDPVRMSNAGTLTVNSPANSPIGNVVTATNGPLPETPPAPPPAYVPPVLYPNYGAAAAFNAPPQIFSATNG